MGHGSRKPLAGLEDRPSETMDPAERRLASERVRKRSALDLLALLGLWAPYAIFVRRFWFLNDDAFISFRYASMWAHGHGLRFNLGPQPPVEGYSNFLWVVVSAFLEWLDLDVTLWTPLLSAASGAVFLAFLYDRLRLRFALDRPVAFLSVLSLACFPPFFVWSTSGLETMPFALALFVTFERLALRDGGPAPVAGGAAGLAVALLRIEGVFWAALMGVVALYLRRRRGEAVTRPFAVYFTLLGAGFLAYTAARYAYFGTLIPNPVYVKVKLRADVLLRGYRYLASYCLNFLTPLLVVPAAIFAVLDRERRLRSAGVAIAFVALAVPADAVLLGGDWMAMGRFFVPGLAFHTLLVAFLLDAGWRRLPRLRPAIPAAVGAVVLVALLPAWNVQLVPRSTLRSVDFMYGHPEYKELSEYERFRHEAERPAVKKEEALAFRRISEPGDRLVTGEIGAIGYYSDLYIYDRFGLVSREVALAAADFDEPLRSPGHDLKVSRDFFLEDYPTFITHLVLWRPHLRDRVTETAREWRGLYGNMLWRRYAPDFAVMGDEPVSEARGVLLALRLIEERPDDPLLDLPRPERREIRKRRARKRWRAFCESAALLPND